MRNCPVLQYCRSLSCLDCCGTLTAEEAAGSELPLLYKKMLPSDPDHPIVAERQELRRESRAKEKRRKQSDSYRNKSRLVKQSYRNERETRETIIRATQRSGAENGDGDSRLGDGQWGIDDKLQTRSTSQFTISVAEIDKASRQRSVIVVTLATGRKFVVADIDDFCSCAAAMAEVVKNQATTTTGSQEQG